MARAVAALALVAAAQRAGRVAIRALKRGHLFICLWCVGDVRTGQVRPDADDLNVG
jgi:hypothetical protein